MNFLKELILLAILTNYSCLAASVKTLTPTKPSESYTHSSIIDEDDPDLYKIFWKQIEDNKAIQFELHCRTTGWVGIGLSPNGDMAGSDIAISWVDSNGVAHVKDTFAKIRSTPQIDKSQDWFLIEAREINGYTIVKLRRNLDTCDKEGDLEIRKETNYLVFAWNDKDPVTGVNDWQYHGKNRRIKVEFLLNYKDETLEQEDLDIKDAFIHEMKLNNHPIPPKSTYYYCQFYELPTYDFDVQLIRYDIISPKSSKDILHHIVVHECDRSILNSAPYGAECGPVRAPADIGQCLSSTIVVAWGVGGVKELAFPRDTGYPLYKNEKKKVVVFEYHFDNPRLESGRTDSSGVRFYYTRNLRKNELGVLELTSPMSPFEIQIPPRQKELQITSICYPECSNRFIPSTGINVFSGFLHSHTVGKAIRTLLVRDDKVIANLFDNPKYDFNYQYNIEIEPTKIYKNDTLILECKYSTLNKDEMTFWGFGTQDEMCMNFMYYYPRMTNFEKCISKTEDINYFNFYKKLIDNGHVKVNGTFTLETVQKNKNLVMNLLSSLKYTDEIRDEFQQFFSNPGSQEASCGAPYKPDAINKLKKPFYTPKEYLPAPVSECKVKS